MSGRFWSRREVVMLGGAYGLFGLGHGVTDRRGVTPYAAVVLRKMPVAYLRLGENDGPTAIDQSGNSNTGRYHGQVTYGIGGAVHGDRDAAVSVDGQDAYVEVPDSPQLSQGNGGKGLTVEVWMRPDALVFEGETQDHYVHWLGKGETGELEWGFRFYSRRSSRPNRVSAYIWNPDGGLGSGAYIEESMRQGQWIHIAACYDPGDKDDPSAGVSIYKNGVLKGSPRTQSGALYRTYSIRPHRGGAPLRLGTRDLGSFFQGGLDEFAIYPRVLSADEIAENYRLATRG